MLPTLFGRLQTRLFLLATVGSVVTLALTPLLPFDDGGAAPYATTFTVLAAVAVLGLGWELVYHLAMQWRWEKDWPTAFGLLTAVPEGLLVGGLAAGGALPGLAGPVAVGSFLVHFTAVWLAVWLAANGPMRVPFTRWRFRGGRLL